MRDCSDRLADMSPPPPMRRPNGCARRSRRPMLWCGRNSTGCSNRHMAKGVWGICPGLPSLLYIWPPGSFLRRKGGAVFVLLSALRYAPSAPSGRARCCTGRLSSPARPALCWGRCWSKQLAILAPLGCQKQKEAWESAPRLLVFFFRLGRSGMLDGGGPPLPAPDPAAPAHAR